jgi:beta-N-acetylhexosaminidase
MSKDEATPEGPAVSGGKVSGSTPPAQIPELDKYKERANEILAGMSDSEKIYQLFIATPEQVTGIGLATAAGQTTKDALAQKPVGGLIYFKDNAIDRNQFASMLSNSQSYAKIPMFLGVDEEGGQVARLSSNPAFGLQAIPPMKDVGATGDSAQAHDIGVAIGNNLKPLGVNIPFAPVADVLVNQKNSEIGNRSFGSDPNLVAAMVSAEVAGLHESGMVATLKHFPGHGSTSSNSHNGYSESSRTLDEMRGCEFIPFVAGINAGADIVLISHMSAVNVDSSGVPASVSPVIINQILRGELGYKGVVCTDAMNMGAITDRYSSADAAVLAIEAGVDIILMPKNFDEAYAGILNAVSSGRISAERINESVVRILEVKLARGIMQ